MVQRMLALVPDEQSRDQIDLVRALYDREQVDATPPHIPVTDQFDDHYGLDALQQLLEVVLGLFHPFMLELGAPQCWYDDGEHLLQMLAEQGAEDAQRISSIVYRDIFPEQAPNALIRSRSPLERTALTVGRFRREAEALSVAESLSAQRYFLVVTHVGVFDVSESSEGVSGWSLRRSLPLGSMMLDQ